MTADLHILVTCTKRKSLQPDPRLMMREVGQSHLDLRLANWISRISAGRKPPVEARELYAGDHWNISTELPDLARRQGFTPTMWIISAGYGLIEASDRLQPYAAAFSPGHPDCVVHPSHPTGIINGFKEWWVGMANWEGPTRGQPRTIAQLFRMHANATFLVVASELYLKAVWPDLIQAGAGIAGKGRMMIVSAGMKEFGPLAEYAIPVDARLSEKLGGARRSLNVRMARALLSWLTPDMTTGSVQKRCAVEINGLKLPVAANRDKCSDAEVIEFIRKSLADKHRASAGGLLKVFRGALGRACEQKRFSKLFRQVRESKIA